MRLSDITPLILTWNEEANLRRCLDRLRWAERIVIVDSGSTDETLAIVSEFKQAEVYCRPFQSFADQCNFGLTKIGTKWALSLDADYILPAGISAKFATLDDEAGGYRLPFRYCVFGRPLRSTLYPPRTVLYQCSKAAYENDGHGHRVKINGTVSDFSVCIDHDDRKPLARWLESQRKYAVLEADKLLSSQTTIGLPDRLRKMIWPAPLAAFVYTLIAKRLIFDGWAGWYYVLQRTYAELLLSIELLDRKLRNRQGS